tara:strand:+ start:1343 stop:1447 length:105 start_codon:yes stop_codon:yes gene_type:complete
VCFDDKSEKDVNKNIQVGRKSAQKSPTIAGLLMI